MFSRSLQAISIVLIQLIYSGPGIPQSYGALGPGPAGPAIKKELVAGLRLVEIRRAGVLPISVQILFVIFF